MITQERLKVKYNYDPEGWLIRRYTGRRIGRFGSRYIYIRVEEGEDHPAHRLIWLWHFGYWPTGIDHINGNRYDNRIENLRECNQRQNSGNANWGPMRGIEKHGRKYRVRISTDTRKIELGSYATLNEAKIARDKGYSDYFGEFTRV